MTAPIGRLLHLGSAVVDLVFRIDRLPEPGAEAVARSFEARPGGGYNVMVAAARAGLPVAYAGAHGRGPNGDLLRAAMVREGIEVLMAPDPARDSGTCVVLLTDDAERTFVSWPGAEGHLDRRALAGVQVRTGDAAFASGYPLTYPGSRGPLAEAIERLPEDIVFVFDPSPVVADIPEDILERVLARTTWLSLNRAEARVLAGPDDPKHVAARLLGRCPSASGVVLRAGEAGCILALRGADPVDVPAPKVSAVDTNGAGDVHIGAFLAALAEGRDGPDAAGFANAAAALSVTRPGGDSAPTRAETLRFMHEREG